MWSQKTGEIKTQDVHVSEGAGMWITDLPTDDVSQQQTLQLPA